MYSQFADGKFSTFILWLLSNSNNFQSVLRKHPRIEQSANRFVAESSGNPCIDAYGLLGFFNVVFFHFFIIVFFSFFYYFVLGTM